MATKTNTTASNNNQVTLDVVGESRARVENSGVELTDEVYGKLSNANQLLVNLHEKFIGTVEKVGEYQGRYYVLAAHVDAVGAKLGV